MRRVVVSELINPQTDQKGLSERLLEILLVEDNRGDVFLVAENLKELKNINFHLNIVSDGEEAINFLNHFPGYEKSPDPDLVLLDLHLPKKDGWEVLREMKGNNRLCHIPVCILTGYEQDYVVLKDCTVLTKYFMCKPVDAGKIYSLLQTIQTEQKT
jgi:CheY-like chemotaxis protein